MARGIRMCSNTPPGMITPPEMNMLGWYFRKMVFHRRPLLPPVMSVDAFWVSHVEEGEGKVGYPQRRWVFSQCWCLCDTVDPVVGRMWTQKSVRSDLAIGRSNGSDSQNISKCHPRKPSNGRGCAFFIVSETLPVSSTI